MGMEPQDINWERVAANIRRVAEQKVNEAQAAYPFLSIPGGAKKPIERALGLSHGRVFDSRWNGDIPYTIGQVAVIADLLGVRAADLLNQNDD